MTEKSNQLSVISYQYDNMNRITNTLSLRSLRSFAASFSYDSNGNRTNITYPGGLSVGYQYDEDNRLKELTANEANSFSFNYDSASRMTNITYPNGIDSIFGYDAESRVTSIQPIGTNGTAFINRAITRDGRGYKTSENYLAGLEPTLVEGEQYIECNELDRITHIDERDTWFGGELNQWYNKDLTYNANSALTNMAVTRPSWNTNTTIATYTNSYERDADGRLVIATKGTKYTKYLYDALWGRIAKITSNGSQVTTNYLSTAESRIMSQLVWGETASSYFF